VLSPSAPLPPPSAPPAGWYPDPSGAGRRYFDGRSWAPLPGAADASYWARAEAKPRHPTLRLSDALGALAVLAVSLVVAKTVSALLDDTDVPLLVYAALSAAIGYGPSLVWCRHILQRESGGLGRLGWRFRWSDAGWGPLTWVAAVACQIVMAIVVLITRIPITSNVDDVNESDVTTSYIIAMVATAVIAAPLVEELVFRGVVLRGLAAGVGVIAAVPIQGVLFGLAHVDPSRGWGNLGLVMVLSAVGCAFGAAAAIFRRIGPTIVAHAIFNGVVLAIVLSGVLDEVDTDLRLVRLVGGALASAV
jgi:membrane protease YdiL (CAAX protease family)